MKITLRAKAVIVAALFAVVLLGIVAFITLRLEHSSDQIITSSRLITESAAYQLNRAGHDFIDSLVSSGFFEKPELTNNEEKHVDSLLSAISARLLGNYEGMEGGYYFQQADVFLGYSFPTSPLPKPAFGPPPRSYYIIRDQAREAIDQHQQIIRIHGFDPAQFPLATQPIYGPHGVIGCSWSRVHIERLIPTLKLTDVLVFAGAISLIGFIVLLAAAWRMRKHVEEIRLGLETLHTNESYRFAEQRGVFGDITRSINEMINARTLEQQRRESLERNLHQRDKMVTLGTLIAGVAHEVKTPLAIIKTRIQLWQRKLQQREQDIISDDIFSPESLEMVVHEINRLSDLVKRLLVFSKPVSSRFHPGNVNHILEQVLSLVQPDAMERGIFVKTNLDPSLPSFPLDNQAMEQVFLNIIGNSVDATPLGGTIEVRSMLPPERTHVAIEIEDTGKGIPEDELSKIFNPFFTTKDHGVGLGLSISFEIVRAHRGSIEFLPKTGPGALCRILLPLAKH